MKHAWLNRDTHTITCHYALFTDDASFQRELKRLKVKEELKFAGKFNAACVHKIEHKGKMLAIVSMSPKKGKLLEEHYGLLVHEAMHIWQWHLELIGEEKPSAEFEAYAVQQISQQLMHAFRTQTGRKKTAAPKNG